MRNWIRVVGTLGSTVTALCPSFPESFSSCIEAVPPAVGEVIAVVVVVVDVGREALGDDPSVRPGAAADKGRMGEIAGAAGEENAVVDFVSDVDDFVSDDDDVDDGEEKVRSTAPELDTQRHVRTIAPTASICFTAGFGGVAGVGGCS